MAAFILMICSRIFLSTTTSISKSRFRGQGIKLLYDCAPVLQRIFESFRRARRHGVNIKSPRRVQMLLFISSDGACSTYRGNGLGSSGRDPGEYSDCECGAPHWIHA